MWSADRAVEVEAGGQAVCLQEQPRAGHKARAGTAEARARNAVSTRVHVWAGPVAR